MGSYDKSFHHRSLSDHIEVLENHVAQLDAWVTFRVITLNISSETDDILYIVKAYLIAQFQC